MRAIKALLPIIFLLSGYNTVPGQTFAHGMSSSYAYPADEKVAGNLERWRDLKFGMLIHWGLYSQHGIVESWSICSEEEDWIPRDSTIAYDDYKRDYWAAINTFKPEAFDPESWAAAGYEAGMRYVVFTTKHHDGFNMFDTKQTDFSISRGAFREHPKNNVAKWVFEAFRDRGYMVGAYFSKPDWHCQYYWWDRYATPDRGVNYSLVKNPWRWEQFKKFTYNQIEEIVGGEYGKIDLLWLDGGWVRPAREGEAERLGRRFKGSQDIDMPRIAAMARSYNPEILIVDRTVAGEFENYRTPERGIPDQLLEYPWESCIPLGNDWGYVPGDIYKSPREVIRALVEITAKGGNLLLGIGPKPDGTLPEEVTLILEKIGEWMEVNSEAIYGTRPLAHYNDGDTWFTASENGRTVYAIYFAEKGSRIPEHVRWKGNFPAEGSAVSLLGNKSESGPEERLDWHKEGNEICVTLPADYANETGIFVMVYQLQAS